jgi:nucleoside-diphosphate-sugar epimerase
LCKLQKRGVVIRTISILGSGWLGLPLAKYFVSMGDHVKASTTSISRLQELSSLEIEPFILDIGQLPGNLHVFLRSNILIVNIPSKNIDGFNDLIKEIESSEIEKVLFVSSTSVYRNQNKTLFESDAEEPATSPLLEIEYLFRKNSNFKNTIVRFGGLIGYGRNPGRFLNKGSLVHNPDSNVNLIHRDDCINIIRHIVEQEVWGEVFNCCADTHPTKRSYYTQAAKRLGVPAPEFEESGARAFKIISSQKVKRMLNYEFLYPDLMDIKFEEST